VACWGGKTSTPADQETRAARKQAHSAFDPLWKKKRYKRGDLYRMLRVFMGTGKDDTHIGMFDIEQCAKVLEFVEQLTRGKSRGTDSPPRQSDQ